MDSILIYTTEIFYIEQLFHGCFVYPAIIKVDHLLILSTKLVLFCHAGQLLLAVYSAFWITQWPHLTALAIITGTFAKQPLAVIKFMGLCSKCLGIFTTLSTDMYTMFHVSGTALKRSLFLINLPPSIDEFTLRIVFPKAIKIGIAKVSHTIRWVTD